MINLKNKVVLCYDYGSYIGLAQRLAREDGFGKVYYFLPKQQNGYPTHRPFDVGRNVEGITVIDEWASVIDEVDICVFPDVYEPALQEFFVSLGKAVFGSKYGGRLEYDRVLLKNKIEELDLPIGEYWVAKGVGELESILKEHENVYVKSSHRGDSETWKSTNYLLSKGELNRLRASLGIYATEEVFVVESKIESLAEIGVDSFSVNGDFPEKNLSGIEVKDNLYVGKIIDRSELPLQLKKVSDRLSNTFNELGYCSFYSDEVIIGTDRKGYLIDITARAPQPPSDLMLELYTNFPEIVWMVGNGITPSLEYKHIYGVQFIIRSELAKKDPSPIIVPDEYKRFVKVKNLTIDDDGVWWYVPLSDDLEMCEIGSVVSTGNTMYEAVQNAKNIAESIKGFDIKINTDCIEEVKEQISRLKNIGIHYLD